MKLIHLASIAIAMLITSCTTQPQNQETDEPPMEELQIEDIDLLNLPNHGSIFGQLKINDEGSYIIVQNAESRSNKIHILLNPEDFDLNLLVGLEVTASVEVVEEISQFVKKVKLLNISENR